VLAVGGRSVASGFFFSENFFKRFDEFMVFSVSAHQELWEKQKSQTH
jgi:hypothetical protein